MQDGRKRFSARMIKLALVVTVPAALLLILYSHPLLSVIGTDYSDASVILQALLAGCVVAPIIRGYASYVHALDKYLHVTLIGVVLSVTQLIAYALLIPSMGAIGAAVAYSLGFFVALIAVHFSSLSVGFRIDWLSISKITIVPAVCFSLLYLLNVPWFVGSFMTRIAKLKFYCAPFIRALYG
jgi:O-antigen/teichoic acid export membrane protein